MGELLIKVPESDEEFQAMWQLNHEVFAGELGQHPRYSDCRLVDKFHYKNRYRIAWDGSAAVGMICAHSEPPFSAEMRFGQVIASRIRKGKTAEIRLFAVRKEYRFTTLPARLAVPLLLELKSSGIENIIISAVEFRRRLYSRLGFITLGESVMDGASRFYPMAAELESLCRHCQCVLRRYQ